MDIKDIQMQKELDNLDKVQKEWIDKIDKEEKTEQEIINAIDTITSSIVLQGKTRAVVDDVQYALAVKVINVPKQYRDHNGDIKEGTGRQIVLVVTNIMIYNIVGNKYTPTIVRSDYDERYDTKANIRAAVEGWIRHITGTIKPEIIE